MTARGFARVPLRSPRRRPAADLTSIKWPAFRRPATTVLYAIQRLVRPYGLDVDMQPQHNGPSVMSGVVGNSYQIENRARPR